MTAKKLILFIVEGITDQTSLGTVLNELLDNNEVRFAIAGGDITTQKGSTSHNIAAKIGNLIKEFSGNTFTARDFLEVVHLVDMDGAYISPDKVVLDQSQKPVYTDENILTSNMEGIQRRNVQKGEILSKLISLNKVWRTVPYSVYFFSCNLDHVLYNKNNLSRSEKMEYARKFEDEYIGSPEQFIDFLSKDGFAVQGKYGETWDFIKADENSLKRFSNFQLYFEL